MRTRVGRTSGVSILELAVYVALTGIVSAPIIVTMLGSSRITAEQDVVMRLSSRSRAALARISEDLRRAFSDSVVIGTGGTSITFALPDGYDGVDTIEGDTIRYELVNGENDVQLERTNVTASTTFVVMNGLTDASSFERDGTSIVATLVSRGIIAHSGDALVITRNAIVTPRN